MNSQGQRENILSSDYSNVGIGFAYDGKNYLPLRISGRIALKIRLYPKHRD
jgi:uncharacterized protein YkwD